MLVVSDVLIENFSVRAHRHALGLYANLDVAEADALLEIDDRDGVVVLVGDVEDLAVGVLGEQFRIGSRGQGIRRFCLVAVSIIWMVSSSPTATITNLPSRVNSMPRGRWPTLMVSVTVHLSVSITDTVLPFSFDT